MGSPRGQSRRGEAEGYGRGEGEEEEVRCKGRVSGAMSAGVNAPAIIAFTRQTRLCFASLGRIANDEYRENRHTPESVIQGRADNETRANETSVMQTEAAILVIIMKKTVINGGQTH